MKKKNNLLRLEGGPKGEEKKSLACLNLTLIRKTMWEMIHIFHLFPLFLLKAFFHYTAYSFIPKHFRNSQLLQPLTQQII